MKEFNDIQEAVNAMAFTMSQKIAFIIENELKQIAETYNVNSAQLILSIHPMKDNATRYDIDVKLKSFEIKTDFVNKGEE